MRGNDEEQGAMFSYISVEERIPEDHPLRPIKRMVGVILKDMWRDFSRMYSKLGRRSIPPEQLLRALLLQALYTIRSERMLVEQINYNLLFKWFVGLGMDDTVWNHSTFTKNRERFLRSDLAGAFFTRIIEQAKAMDLLSDEHFTVDGTLIEGWASLKSFQPKDNDKTPTGRNQTVDFRGDKRVNQTHESKTDPDLRLFRKGKGKEAKLVFMGHVLMENRNGLVVDTRLTPADGHAERNAALEMVSCLKGRHRITLSADKAYDEAGFVKDARFMRATPHVSQNTHSAIDRRTTRHPGYAISQRVRKRVEEIFGWIKTVGNFRKTRHRGLHLVDWMFTLTAAAYNLVRIRNILAAQPA
ncbi:MAG TPA: IS5 family transposase [Anaerolineaceae bacterium]|jgi:transposase|nr:IS5 family transposase [Anaerolineaceae bacterium]